MPELLEELRSLESETFEIEDIELNNPVMDICSCSCSTSSCTSCSTSSTCSCSTSTSSSSCSS